MVFFSCSNIDYICCDGSVARLYNVTAMLHKLDCNTFGREPMCYQGDFFQIHRSVLISYAQIYEIKRPAGVCINSTFS